MDEDGIAPGRTSFVFTTHDAVIKEAKRSNDVRSLYNTAHGLFPDLQLSGSMNKEEEEETPDVHIPNLSRRKVEVTVTPFPPQKSNHKIVKVKEHVAVDYWTDSEDEDEDEEAEILDLEFEESVVMEEPLEAGTRTGGSTGSDMDISDY